MVCRYIGGVRFQTPWGRIHSPRNDRSKRRQQIFQAFPPLALPPLQAFDAESQLLQPLDPLQRLGQIAAVAMQVNPFLTPEIVFRRGLQDLDNAVAGDPKGLWCSVPAGGQPVTGGAA